MKYYSSHIIVFILFGICPVDVAHVKGLNHVKSGVIYFSAFILSYDTIHVSGTIHTWNRGLTSGIRA